MLSQGIIIGYITIKINKSKKHKNKLLNSLMSENLFQKFWKGALIKKSRINRDWNYMVGVAGGIGTMNPNVLTNLYNFYNVL